MGVGKKIRRHRLEQQLKQTELAKKAGISNTYLSDIEVGRTEPSLNTLNKLITALGIEISHLFD